MKTQATPRLEVIKKNGKTEIAKVGGRLVAEMFEGEEDSAELIVRAVNFHEELVEFVTIFESGVYSTAAMVLKARDLLKRARGES